MFRRGIERIIRTGAILTIVPHDSRAKPTGLPEVEPARDQSDVLGPIPPRLGGFISSTSPGKVFMERDDNQSLFGSIDREPVNERDMT